MKTAEIFPPIPSDTARTARAIFGSSNFYMTTGDQANQLFHGLIESGASPPVRIPARLMAELYLITIFQYLEALPDSQAADAVRERRDWKYALHLPLTISGFQPSMFCEFRKFLLIDQASQQTLQTLIARLAEIGETNGGSLQKDSRLVVLRVCLLSRLASVWETFSQTLEALAIRQPERLRAISQPYWYGRYSQPRGKLNLRASSHELEKLAQAIGNDGFYLLEAIAGEVGLADLPEASSLRQVWEAQYERVEGKVVWRKDTCANCPMVSRMWDPSEQTQRIEEEGYREKFKHT